MTEKAFITTINQKTSNEAVEKRKEKQALQSCFQGQNTVSPKWRSTKNRQKSLLIFTDVKCYMSKCERTSMTGK